MIKISFATNSAPYNSSTVSQILRLSKTDAGVGQKGKCNLK